MNTNAIPGLETFYQWNNALLGAPVGVLVGLLCLALGYALKVIPCIDNKWIPTAVIVAGVIFFPLLSERGETIYRIWIAKNIVLGFIVACLTWLLHNKLLKRIEAKFGFFQETSTNEPTTPP